MDRKFPCAFAAKGDFREAIEHAIVIMAGCMDFHSFRFNVPSCFRGREFKLPLHVSSPLGGRR